MATVFFHSFQSNGLWLISSLAQSQKKKKNWQPCQDSDTCERKCKNLKEIE